MGTLVLWLAGIVVLLGLLAALGGFRRPVVVGVVVVLVIALVVGFLAARRL